MSLLPLLAQIFLRNDEYVNLPDCLDRVDVPKDQLNTVITR
jgi:hypothetical protein